MTQEENKPGRRRWRRPLLKGVGAVLLLLLLVAVVGGLWLRSRLMASLPQLSGEVVLVGLTVEVTVERDAEGLPTLKAANRLDLARAVGFLHAQERFFQMDLLRRNSAGELAEIIGPVVLDVDEGTRLHRFRHRAVRVLQSLPEEHRAILDAYAAGVNAGLGALKVPPFEYLAMSVEPAPWKAEDSLLVVYSMYLDLQGIDDEREHRFGILREALGEKLTAFLAPLGSPLDAPMLGEPFPVPTIPGPEAFQMEASEQASFPTMAQVEAVAEPAGSNNWAVAGSHTATGAALVANDMHLGLQMPNIWFRATMEYSQGGEARRISGVMLPGTPVVVVGSNGHVAWGFTNSQTDTSDLVIVEPDPEDPEGSYRTAEGPRSYERAEEIIRVKGAESATVEVVETLWGPVIRRDYRDRPIARAWVAYHPQGLNMGLLAMEGVRDVDQAMEVANLAGIPAQNIVLGDRSGRVAWTLAGRLPARFGHDGRFPSSWADGSRGWNGLRSPEEIPRLVDPENGKLWSANNRVVSGDALAVVGDGGYAPGPRAAQIRDGLLPLEAATPEDLLAIQLDDRALYHRRWQEFLLTEVLTPEAVGGSELRAVARQLVEGWDGRASVDSAGYRVLRGFRVFLLEDLGEALTARCRDLDPSFRYSRGFFRSEAPLWQLIQERPAHFLDPNYPSWEAYFLAVLDESLRALTSDGTPLKEAVWGKRNTVRIQHPLSRAVPMLSRWLDMEPRALPGDSHLPRVQHPSFGASQRMVVSPGREEEGIFHMPGGPSGHPLSPFYRSGQGAWEVGTASPFLPGAAEHTLVLKPPTAAQ